MGRERLTAFCMLISCLSAFGDELIERTNDRKSKRHFLGRWKVSVENFLVSNGRTLHDEQFYGLLNFNKCSKHETQPGNIVDEDKIHLRLEDAVNAERNDASDCKTAHLHAMSASRLTLMYPEGENSRTNNELKLIQISGAASPRWRSF